MSFPEFGQLKQPIREKIVELIELSIYKKNLTVSNYLNEDLYCNDMYTLKINIDLRSSIPKDETSEKYIGRRIYRYGQLLSIAPFLNTLLIKFFIKTFNIRDISKISNENPQMLNEKINGKYFEEIIVRANTSIEEKSTRMYLCKKCNTRKAKTNKQQTRGLDEAVTIFVECLTCGNNWRLDS